MLRAGCDVARQEVSKVAGTCVLQLVMPEKWHGGKDNINNGNQVTQEVNRFL